MSDKELLEWAAKAAGMWRGAFEIEDDSDQPVFDPVKGFRLAYGRGWWNPLTDDGDALRLAVKLRLSIQPVGGAVYAAPPRSVVRSLGLGIISAEFMGDDELNPKDEEGQRYLRYLREDYPEKIVSAAAATRRAITRAAAEIGKAMA